MNKVIQRFEVIVTQTYPFLKIFIPLFGLGLWQINKNKIQINSKNVVG